MLLLIRKLKIYIYEIPGVAGNDMKLRRRSTTSPSEVC